MDVQWILERFSIDLQWIFNGNWKDVQCIFNGFSIAVGLIPMHFQWDVAGFPVDLQCFL